MLRRSLLGLLAGASLAACIHAPSAGSDGFKMIAASEANAKQTAGSKLTFADANGVAFRQKHGVIPGAILLTDFKKYDASELPADKDTPLVFYCANSL